MLKKIKMGLDRVLWTMTVFGAVLIIAGIFLITSQDNINGVWPFLLGFGTLFYAEFRIKILNRKLSKDFKGNMLRFLLVMFLIFTTVAVLVPPYMLILSISFFIISLRFEAFSIG